MLPPTPESVDKRIDAFIGRFDAFDARLVEHANPDTYFPLSDKIAMFSIYMQQME